MKKFIIAIFATMCICVLAAADDAFKVTIDAVMDAFYMRSFTGDFSLRKPVIAGSPYKYQGEGDMSAFNSSMFDDGLNGRVKFVYSGEKLGGLLEFRANTDSAILDNWYYEAWLKLGTHIRVLTGNRGQRGQVDQFPVYDDFLSTKIDYFGVLYPAYQWTPHYNIENNFDTIAEFPWGIPGNEMTKGFALYSSTDTNDLFMPAGASSRNPLNLLLDVNFEPVTVSFSLGGLFSSVSRPFKMPWLIGQKGRANDYDDQYDPVEKGSTIAGVRIELSEIADAVNLAAVYKYAGTSLYKRTAKDRYDIVGEDTGNHTFGLYADITPFNDFGISLGYSGLLQSWKNAYDSDISPDLIGIVNADQHFLSGYRNVNFPFYHGIDLRFHYSGLKDFTFSLNNNVSFGTVNGADNSARKYSNTWVYIGELNGSRSVVPGIEDRSESYIGLHNALGIQYALAENFIIDLQAANQYGQFTLNWEKDSVSSFTNYLGLYCGVKYSVFESEKIRASIRGGLAFKLSSFSYQNAVTSAVHKAGFFDLGIPLGIKVEF